MVYTSAGMQPFDWSPLGVREPLSRDAIESRARSLVAGMTLDEKVASVSGDVPFWPGLTTMLEAYNVRPWPSGATPRLGLPGIQFTDGPRGVALGRSTCFPVSMARGATWEPALEARVGDVIGVEARAQGANLIASVCVNLLRHPAWGRAQETYGEDTVHVGAMGAALTGGIQRHIMACVKHFACNNIENSRFYVDVEVDERTLHEVYLPHFEACVKAGAASVMSAYNRVNGDYCGEHRGLLTGVLREKWGFEGFVVSDFLFGLRSGERAFNAGMDLELPLRNRFLKELPAAVRGGRIPPSQLDEGALRLVRQQLRFAGVGEPGRYTPESVASDSHRALAYEVARRSMVLLRNEPVRGRPLLPLDVGQLRRVAVLGRLARKPNLGDRGSSMVHPATSVTPLDGLREALPNATVTYADGAELGHAAELARDADVAVVVVGLTHWDEGEHVQPPLRWDLARVFEPPPLRELPRLARALRSRPTLYTSGDRRTLELRPEDESLIRTAVKSNPATVVVLIGGSAIVTESWRELVPAVVMAWYPGMEGGRALADLLLGRADFEGRLPCVFPADARRLPYFSSTAERVRYDLLHGQRLYEAKGWKPAFPLGFGLGYTRFERSITHAERRGDEIVVHARVENHGPRDGAELVQVRALIASDAEPSRLAGFARVAVKARTAETAEVRIPVRRLARYNPARGAWELPGSAARLFLADEGAYEATVTLG